jgi:hypothetical protein
MAPVQRAPTRNIQFAAAFGDQRKQSMMRCISGMCGISAPYDLFCTSCNHTAHAACFSVSGKHSDASDFRCPWCLASKVTQTDDEPTAELLSQMAELTISELGASTERSEAGGIANLRSAARRYGDVVGVPPERALEGPVPFAAMLRRVMQEEGFPKSVEKHITSMSKVLDQRRRAQQRR